MRFFGKVYDPRSLQNGIWEYKGDWYYIHVQNETCCLLDENGYFVDDVVPAYSIEEILKNGKHIKLC